MWRGGGDARQVSGVMTGKYRQLQGGSKGGEVVGGCRPGSPFGLEDKTHWMFNFGGFTDSTSLQTRGLDTIQATSFFPCWWLLSSFKTSLRQREICKKILRNHRPVIIMLKLQGPKPVSHSLDLTGSTDEGKCR